MKKRAIKKLLTCPHCKIGGFVNLAHHVCKAKKALAKQVEVEVLPPVDKKALNECAEQIRRVHSVIENKTRRFQQDVIYDLVELGLYFLKAKKAIGHGNFEDFVENGPTLPGRPLVESLAGKSATVADLKNDAEPCFPRVSIRSARNYMNAATNAGLTEKSTAEDVEKLRRKEALHGRKPTDLYRLTDKSEEDDGEEESSKPKWHLIREVAVNLREHCDTVVELKPQMNKKVFSTVCARLQRTLEELTGHPWDMVAKEFANAHGPKFKEHGDVYDLGS